MVFLLVVFCTKFRRHILTAERRDFTNTTLHSIAESVKCEIIEFGAEEDHIHFLLRYPPTVELSAIVGTLKTAGRQVGGRFTVVLLIIKGLTILLDNDAALVL